jgi:hypothetical protein
MEIEEIADRLAYRMLKLFQQKFPQKHTFNNSIMDRYSDKNKIVKYLSDITFLIKKNNLKSIEEINNMILNYVI